MTPPEQPKNGRRRPYRRSGFYTARRALVKYGTRVLPGPETPIGRELRAWRDSLIADLGGLDVLSTQQLALVEEVFVQRYLVSSLNGYVLSLPSLVNKTKRGAFTIMRDRATEVGLLRDLLRDLGLERQAKQIDLPGYFAELHRQEEAERQQQGDGGGGEDGSDDDRDGHCIGVNATERPPGGGDDRGEGGGGGDA